MKTVAQLRKEQDQILNTDKGDYLKKRDYTQATNRLTFLNTCIAYLLSNPKKEFLLKEVARIEHRMDEYLKLFPLWIPKVTYDSDRMKLTAYKKECGFPDPVCLPRNPNWRFFKGRTRKQPV